MKQLLLLLVVLSCAVGAFGQATNRDAEREPFVQPPLLGYEPVSELEGIGQATTGVAFYLPRYASAPRCFQKGAIYFDTVLNKARVCVATGSPGTWETSASGAAVVATTGTPSSGQVAFFSAGTTITGDSDLTFATDTLTVTKLGATTLTGTISGGGQQLNNVIIGTTTPLAGSFTTMNASTSVTSPIYISSAADPADAGAIRLGNNEFVEWEKATPGTDWSLGVNASDQLVSTAPFGAMTLAGTVSGGGQQLNNIIIGTTTPLAGSFTTMNTTKEIITSGTLGDQVPGISFTATMPTVATGQNFGALFVVTGAGSSAQEQVGFNTTLIQGYTGTSSTTAGRFFTQGSGTGGNINTYLGNFGVSGTSQFNGTGYQYGVYGRAESGNLNSGIVGQAIVAKNSGTNIGVLGFGKNTGTSPIELGGYFGLQSTDPTFTSAALMADNGAEAQPILVARDNGTPVFTIADGGNVTSTVNISSATLSTATNCSDSAGAAACGSAAAGSFVVDAATTSTVVSTTAVTANSQIFIQEDSSLGTRLGVTCNTQSSLVIGSGRVTARTAGASFTVTLELGPTTNPACFNYHIVN